MPYSVKNISRQPVIGNLSNGSEFRIPVGGDITITDNQFTGYVKSLADKEELEVLKLDAMTSDNIEVVKSADKRTQKKK